MNMLRLYLIIAGTIILGWLPVRAGWCAVYYVNNSVACGDSWEGSESRPWCTIQKGAETVAPGDAVIVKPGSYNELVVIKRSGTSEKPVTFTSEKPKAAKVSRFTLLGSHLKLDGFSVYHPSPGSAPAIANGGTSNEIRNNHCENYPSYCIYAGGREAVIAGNLALNSQYGIVLEGTGHRVEGNEVKGPKQWDKTQDSDYMRFFGSGHIIRGNKLHGADLGNSGSSHVDCFQTFDNDLSTWNVIIENNYCSDMHQGFIGGGQHKHASRDIIIRNNIFLNGGSWGLAVVAMKDVHAYNNTFVDIKYHGIGCDEASSCHIKNNIFYNSGSGYWNKGKGGVGDHNLVYRSTSGYEAAVFPKDLINTDPLFVDYAKRDFRLKGGSPARDAGVALTGFRYDIDGNPRPKGPAWDIGAFEMGPAPPPPVKLHIVQ